MIKIELDSLSHKKFPMLGKIYIILIIFYIPRNGNIKKVKVSTLWETWPHNELYIYLRHAKNIVAKVNDRES